MIWSSIFYSAMILGTELGLRQVSEMETVFLDSTWLENKHGVLTISDKYHYAHQDEKEVLQEGKRCFSWVFMFCAGRDSNTIILLFRFLCSRIYSLSGKWWKPSVFYIDFDQASVIAIQKAFPGAKIRFCYFHLKQAILRKGSSPNIFGAAFKSVLNLEFTKFWRATKSLNVLEYNLEILSKNLKVSFNGNPEKVKTFMKYFKRTYCNQKHFWPERWLHLHDKEFPFYDPSNNTSETNNNTLKRDKTQAFNIKMCTIKMVDQLKQNEETFRRIHQEHYYKKSLKCSRHLKIKREEKILKKLEKHNQRHSEFEEYKEK